MLQECGNEGEAESPAFYRSLEDEKSHLTPAWILKRLRTTLAPVELWSDLSPGLLFKNATTSIVGRLDLNVDVLRDHDSSAGVLHSPKLRYAPASRTLFCGLEFRTKRYF